MSKATTAKAAPKSPTKSPVGPSRARKTKKAALLPPITSAARPGTKIARFLELLRTDAGVTIQEAATALNWQLHSVRGALSGVIRKRLQLNVERISGNGASHYRLAR